MTMDYTSELVINNLPVDQREFLLLKDTRTEISERFGVQILVRGRLLKPRSDGTLPSCDENVRPLFLLIKGQSKQSISAASQRIHHLLKTGCTEIRNDELANNDEYFSEEKITCGIDVFPANYGMKAKILGDSLENVSYIRKETGADITLRGRGSNYENDNKSSDPLYIHVRYSKPGMKEKTRQLVLNLLETVQKDFVTRYGKFYSRPKKPEIISMPTNRKPFDRANTPTHNSYPRAVSPTLIYGRATTPCRDPYPRVVTPNKEQYAREATPNREPYVRAPTPKRDTSTRAATPKRDLSTENRTKSDVDKISVGLKSVPSNFNLKRKIYGENLSNVKHIEKTAGALLLLQGKDHDKSDSDEPPYLLVKYQKPEMKERGRQLIFNLIETVHHEFIELYGTYPIAPEKPRILPYQKNMDKKRPKSVTLSPNSVDDGPPKRMKPLNTGLLSSNHRSPSPSHTVIPPPPPVISKPSPSKVTEPPVIPLLINKKLKPVPPPEPPIIPLEKPVPKPLLSLTIPPFQKNMTPTNSQMPSYKSGPNSYLSPGRVAVVPPPSANLGHNSMLDVQYNKNKIQTPEPTILGSFMNVNKFSDPPHSITSKNGNPIVGVPNPVIQKSSSRIANRCLVDIQPVKITNTVSNSVDVSQNFTKSNKSKPRTNGVNPNIYDPDAEDGNQNNVICLDSDDEFNKCEQTTVVSLSTDLKMRTIGVQTMDEGEWLKTRRYFCICGKTPRLATVVKTVQTQTVPHVKYF